MINLESEGYGYAISPRLEFQNNLGEWNIFNSPNIPINTARMPLADDNRTTSSLSRFQDGDPNNPQIIPFETDEFFPIIGHRLTGGFTQSPINFNFDANESFEPKRCYFCCKR